MSQLLLVRHGETLWNRENRLQGHLEVPLSDLGKEQAKEVATQLASYQIDTFISSDLLRASQTAEIITTSLPHLPKIIFKEELRERHLGKLQGLLWSEIEKNHTRKDVFVNPRYDIPDGETLQFFRERTVTCLEKIATTYSGVTLIVTHRGVIANLIHATLDTDLEEDLNSKIPNTGIFPASYANGKWKIETDIDILY